MRLFRKKILEVPIEKGNLKRYLLYALVEVFLVMLGILLAFQINNWNSKRIKKREEIQLYENIKRQVADDKEDIISAIEYNMRYLSLYEFANQIISESDRSKIDTLTYIALELTRFSDFHRNGNVYETMLNSGDLKLLNNYNIIEGLQRLEQTYIYLNRMENNHYEFILQCVIDELHSSIDFSTQKVQRPQKLYSFESQNLIISSKNIMNEKDEIYNRALSEIEELTLLIEEEIDSN